MNEPLKAGLVLTGGGARASYQIGVLRAFADNGIEVAAVSAVGAGALNGAIVASRDSVADAANDLEQIWSETVLGAEAALQLGPIPVLKLGTYLTLLFAAGAVPDFHERIKGVSQGAQKMAAGRKLPILPSDFDAIGAALRLAIELMNVGTDGELDSFISSILQGAMTRTQKRFFVSVYETGDGILEPIKHGLQLAGLLSASAPRYLEISDNALSPEDRMGAILASASLPFVCEPGSSSGQRYIDGSFAGMRRSPGAVPLQPFRRTEGLELDVVFVVHTEAGVTWDSSIERKLPIIELRPSRSGAGDVGYFWADKGALADWVRLGRSDTQEKLNKVAAELSLLRSTNTVREALRRKARSLDE